MEKFEKSACKKKMIMSIGTLAYVIGDNIAIWKHTEEKEKQNRSLETRKNAQSLSGEVHANHIIMATNWH